MSNRTRPDQNNHANQLNPNNPAYWSSRGQPPPVAPSAPAAPPVPKPAEK